MTMKQAKLIVKSYNAQLSRVYGEYRVRWPSAGPDADYFTNDLDDAIDTARFEYQRHLRRHDW